MKTYAIVDRKTVTDRLQYLLTISAIIIAIVWSLSVPALAEAMDHRLTGIDDKQESRKPGAIVPKPEMVPENVVRIQLDALANNDTPYQNAGIEIAFRFASPGNKQSIGPLNRFIQLVHNPVYKPMIDHRTARVGNLVIEDEVALLPVYLTASDGEFIGYLFILSRQKGGLYDQCWMTDAVLRFETLSV
jgi:hypothetical protein